MNAAVLPVAPVTREAWRRRARPLLGTLVEVGVPSEAAAASAWAEQAFAAIAEVQACLSRFEPHSELTRFNALAPGERLAAGPHLRAVLAAAARLQAASEGLFDVSCGSAPQGWVLDGAWAHKHDPRTRLDLDGIAKGYAVDCAVAALQALGCPSGWVNAGGDLRTFGAARLALRLRDETAGGVRAFATLDDGAFATSHYGSASRSRLHGRGHGHGHGAPHAHASVAAPQCLWADALTKVVALSGDVAHPALARFGASAWLH